MKIWQKVIKKMWVLLCLFCLLTGCSKQDGTSGNQQRQQTDDRSEENNGEQDGGKQGESIEAGNDNFFWVSNFSSKTYGSQGVFYTERGFVHFLDVQTGSDEIICDDVTCNHAKEKCTAFFDATQTYAALEDEHLLIVTDYGADRLGDMYLYEAGLDGADRKKIAFLGNMQGMYQVLFTEKYIITAYYNTYDDELNPIEENIARIYMYDREKMTGEIIWEKRCFNALVPNVAYQDGKVYFHSFYIDVTMEEVMKYGDRSDYVSERMRWELCSVDVEDKAFRVIHEGLEDTSSLSICQDKIFYSDKGKLWSYNIVTEEEKVVGEKQFVLNGSYGTGWQMLRSGNEYFTCTPDGVVTQAATRTNTSIMAVFPEVIYAFDYNTTDGNGVLVYWDTQEFLVEGGGVVVLEGDSAGRATYREPEFEIPQGTELVTWVIPDLLTEDEIWNQVNRLNKKLYEDGYSLALEVKTLPVIQYRQQVVELLESGEADIASSGMDIKGGTTTYTQELIRAGYFEDLSGYLSSEEGKSLWNWYSELEWKSVETDGKIYSLPNQQGLRRGGYLVFDKDYVTEEMLKDFSGTPEELEQLISSMELPEGVYPVSGTYAMESLAAMSGMALEKGIFFNLKTGKAENPFQNETFCQYLRELNSLYLSGCFKKNSVNVAEISDRNSLIIVPLPFAMSNELSSTIGINRNSTKKNAALELLTLLYTEETYANFFLFGEVDKDYMLVDGYVHSMDGEAIHTWGSMAYGIYDAALPTVDDDMTVNRRKEKTEFYESEYCLDSVVLGFKTDYSTLTVDAENVERVWESYADTIWQEKDIEATLEKAVVDFENAGGQILVEELNRQVSKWMDEVKNKQ